MIKNEDKACPFCGELNIDGSAVCSKCKNIIPPDGYSSSEDSDRSSDPRYKPVEQDLHAVDGLKCPKCGVISPKSDPYRVCRACGADLPGAKESRRKLFGRRVVRSSKRRRSRFFGRRF